MFGMNSDAIYRNFSEGRGPDGLSGSAEILEMVVSTYQERSTRIRALVAEMESSWQGNAADAASTGAGPLAVEHDLSSTALTTAQILTERQAGSFSEARTRVAPPPPEPELANPVVTFINVGAVAEYERQIDDRNAVAQNNVDVMNGYSGASQYNTVNLPTSFGQLSDDNVEIGVDDGQRPTGSAEGAFDTAYPSDSDSGGRADRVTARGSGAGGGNAEPAASTSPEAFVPGVPVEGGPPGRAPVVPAGGPVAGNDVVGPPPRSGPDGGFGPRGGLPGARTPGGVPGPRGGWSGSGSGGGTGSGPRGGGGPGAGAPRGGVGLGGPGARFGTDTAGPAARAGSTPGAVGGRGGAGPAGMPLGAGRGQGDEDEEHQRPEWLRGGDPDELFGTDVVTAPQTIGED